MTEIWRDIKGYEGIYQTSNTGWVKSFHAKDPKGRILRMGVSGAYPMVVLYKNGIAEGKTVHRLVAEAFIENPEGKAETNHKNADPFDNRVENLEWCTRAENMQHAVNSHLLNRGPWSCVPKPILRVNAKGQSLEYFPSMAEAERQTGISSRRICDVCRRKRRTAGNSFWKYSTVSGG